MRFQQALLLQKQQVEQEERQEQTQQLLEKVCSKIQNDYDHNKRLFDPLGRSLARIQAFQRAHPTTAHESTTSLTILKENTENPDNFVKKQVAVRNLNESDMDANALKMYRQLRFNPSIKKEEAE